jgi:uncharacterized membrane protein YcaP (DUF421 family)
LNEFFELIGEGADHLDYEQISIRSVIIFLVALVFIRLSGRRSFGQRSPFDNVLAILMGAILSQSVVNPDIPFFGPIIAAKIIGILHWVFSWISTHSDTFGRLIKGDEKILFENGKQHDKNMKRSFITEKDLMEGIRKEAHVSDKSKIHEAWLERDGCISVVKKDQFQQ